VGEGLNIAYGFVDTDKRRLRHDLREVTG